ncbi:MAG TPA: CHAT domain-containing protein, partial [Niastella sp.]|nr:CHAT domain-containing protein [Niastella sp.]
FYLKRTTNPEVADRIYRDALVLKNMVLFQQQQIYNRIRKSNDSTALVMYNQWRFNKAFLGEQLLLPPAQRKASFDSLQDVTVQLEEQLSRISQLFQITNVSKNVVHRPAPNTAIIEFIRFRLFNRVWTDSIIYAAVVLLPGKKNALFVPLFEERALKELFRFANNKGEAAISYLYPPATSSTYVSRQLYELVWEKLQPLLHGISILYYSPTGLLNRLSFAAIQIGNGKLLADRFTLVQMVCTRYVRQKADSVSNLSTAILWGDIDYNAGNKKPAKWYALPGTKNENRKIFVLLKERNIQTTVRSGREATEELFKIMDGRSPSLIHVATHGFFLPPTDAQRNPMLRNGIVLAGSNILTAYEIAHLDLSNTKLV